jgi:hypothetical protein
MSPVGCETYLCKKKASKPKVVSTKTWALTRRARCDIPNGFSPLAQTKTAFWSQWIPHADAVRNEACGASFSCRG